jgi:multidrug efflux system outer membrane protein
VDRAWWKTYGDDLLRTLIDTARNGNWDLKAAEARIQQARAQRGVRISALLPVPRADADWTQSETSDNANFGQPGSKSSVFTAGFDATWELDVFGRNRRQIEAASAEVRASEFSRDDVMVSLAAEIGRNYLELRGLQDRISVAERNVKAFTEIVAINDSLYEAGQISMVQVEQAKANLQLANATLPTLRADAEAAANRIGVLTGSLPDSLRSRLLQPAPFPRMPNRVATGVPSDLLRRRPDLRVAESRLAAATARIGVNQADLLPRFYFNGGVRADSSSFTGLFAPGAGGYSFGPAISWTGLDIWRVWAQIEEAKGVQKERIAQYQQTVLVAVEEVESSLARWQAQVARSGQLTAAVASSEDAFSLAKSRYERGLEDFLTVLQAELTRLQSEDQLAISRTQAGQELIATYKALGGGW